MWRSDPIVQTTGPLATQTFSSGTGAQVDAQHDRQLVVPITLNPSATNTATCAVAVSPDNSTYSALGTLTEPSGTNQVSGKIQLVGFLVPAGWYVKFTVTNAAIGTGTIW